DKTDGSISLTDINTNQLKHYFKPGDLFRLSIENQSAKDLYVLAWDVSPDGSVLLLNTAETESLPQGKIMNMPILRASEPGGDESFSVFASDKRVEFTNSIFDQGLSISRGGSKTQGDFELMINLGTVYSSLGQYKKAVEY